MSLKTGAIPTAVAEPIGRETYDETRAKDFVFYSGIAYCTESKFMNWTCPQCDKVELEQKTFMYNSTTGARCFVRFKQALTKPFHLATEGQGFVGLSRKENAILVAFRGSQTTLNWIEDFKARLGLRARRPR